MCSVLRDETTPSHTEAHARTHARKHNTMTEVVVVWVEATVHLILVAVTVITTTRRERFVPSGRVSDHTRAGV